MQALRHLYGKLRLQVNEEKSAVARVWDRQFLGYSFWVAAGKVVKRRVSKKALTKFKERVRQITSRSGGRSLQQVAEELRSYVLGWKAYFGLADHTGGFSETWTNGSTAGCVHCNYASGNEEGQRTGS